MLRAGKTRWLRGHAIWISVFAWRGSPPLRGVRTLVQVVTVTVGVAGPEERKHLHRLGDDPVVATMITDDGSTLRIAVAGVHRAVVMGPLQRTADQGSLEV